MADYSEIFRNLPAPGDFEDCYAFSIHKAGSSLMHKMIGEVCRAQGIPAITIPDALFHEGPAYAEWDKDPDLLPYFRPGRLYYGFRHLPPVMTEPPLRLREKRAVLLVRDPRDALVSQYFSFGGKHISHVLPSKNKDAFLQKAKATEDLDIDAYVLRQANNHFNKLQAYRVNLDFDKVLLRRYEQIYYDKRQFLGEIFDHFRLEVDPAILDTVAAKNDIRPTEEVTGKHIRKGEPGDHREKLKPATIEKLNEKFATICRFYGYELA